MTRGLETERISITMKKPALFAVAWCLFLVGSSAMAQGFNMNFGYYTPNPPLVTTCGGATGLPDGRLVKIFQDVDNDGPDLTDPQPLVCTDPPDCVTPFDAVNIDHFFTNGVDVGEGPGYFATLEALTCASTIPANARYYLRIYEADNTTVLWTSTVSTAVMGYQETNYAPGDWTCGAAGPQCTVIDETE